MGYAATGILVTAGIGWLLGVQIVSVYYDLNVPSQILSYAWSVFAISSMVDAAVIMTKFLGFCPLGVKVFGVKIYFMVRLFDTS